MKLSYGLPCPPYNVALVLKNGISWEMCEQLLEEFGEKRRSRINYSQGVLEV